MWLGWERVGSRALGSPWLKLQNPARVGLPSSEGLLPWFLLEQALPLTWSLYSLISKMGLTISVPSQHCWDTEASKTSHVLSVWCAKLLGLGCGVCDT